MPVSFSLSGNVPRERPTLASVTLSAEALLLANASAQRVAAEQRKSSDGPRAVDELDVPPRADSDDASESSTLKSDGGIGRSPPLPWRPL